MNVTVSPVSYTHLDVYKRQPFRLVISLAAIIRCLELALGLEVEEFVSIFIGDILAVFKSFEEHWEHLDMELNMLRRANLVLKQSKCEFIKSEIKFLGYVINADGISTCLLYTSRCV